MKKRIFLGILALLIWLPVLASAGSIPEPPHLGLWVLRDGQLLPVKVQNIVERVGVRGFTTGKEIEVFDIKKTDRILFFSGKNPADVVYLAYLKFVDVVGNPYSGMHRIDLLAIDGTFPFNINPLGIVRGVPLYEIMLDFEEHFLIGQAAICVKGTPSGWILQYNL